MLHVVYKKTKSDSMHLFVLSNNLEVIEIYFKIFNF